MAQTPTASLDETFDALTHSHRRYVLYYLRTHSGAATIDTLSAMLANELEGPSATPGTDTTEHIEVDLHHTHTPKLVDAGLITFARDRQSIELDGINGHDQFIDQAARVDGYVPPTAGD